MTGTTRLMCLGLAAAAAMAASEARAADELLATGQMFGGVSGGRAVCYITNLGAASVTIKGFGILSNGSQIPLVINSCGSVSGATISAGRTCGFAANTGDDIPYGCRAVTSNKLDTRGGFELRGPNPPQAIRNSEALQ